MDEPVSHSPKKELGEFLTIVGDNEVGKPCMFLKYMYLYVFYCLCYVKDIYTDMLEDQVLEERYLDLNEEEDIILYAIRKEHCRDVDEEGDNNKNIHALRWEVYVIQKEDLMKIEFSFSIPQPGPPTYLYIYP